MKHQGRRLLQNELPPPSSCSSSQRARQPAALCEAQGTQSSCPTAPGPRHARRVAAELTELNVAIYFMKVESLPINTLPN